MGTLACLLIGAMHRCGLLVCFVPCPIGVVVKKQPGGMVHIVLIAAKLLLIHVHIPKIEAERLTYLLPDAQKNSVLVKYIVGYGLAKMNEQLVAYHGLGHPFIFTYRYGGA